MTAKTGEVWYDPFPIPMAWARYGGYLHLHVFAERQMAERFVAFYRLDQGDPIAWAWVRWIP